MGDTYVYWLHNSSCDIPENSGYVGVTNNPERRKFGHRKRFADFELSVLFSGTRWECFALEKELRPNPNIGWNIFSGGAAGRIPCNSTREKMSAAKRGRAPHNKGMTLSAEWRAKLSAAKIGKPPSNKGVRGRVLTEEHRAKIGASHKGLKRSVEAIANMRAAQNRPETKEKLSAAGRGRKHTDEARAKIKAAWVTRRATKIAASSITATGT